MKNYMAPMEGVTNYIFRNAYHKYYYPMDKYFTPFISAKANKRLSRKEIYEISPDKNAGLKIVPQILTNNADDFVQLAGIFKNEYGYKEVNLNLGCPSATVTAKGRGSGFLAEPVKLDKFLDEIYNRVDMDISIKTRIGSDYEEDWEYILKIYERYPIYELIIHPRIRTDFYKNSPKLDAYKKAQDVLKIPLCYNGDIHTLEKYQTIKKALPEVDTWMFGRGIVQNPALLSSIYEGKKAQKDTLHLFMNDICREYQAILGDDKTVLFRMKELWAYLISTFTDYEKYAKKIRKVQRLSEYESIVNSLFNEQDLIF